MNNPESIINHYLLGELSEAEQAALEERYFTDPRLFDLVVRAENKLVDDYARERLTPRMRVRFEQYYLAHPNRRERSRFAQTLVTRLDRIEDVHPSADPAVRRAPWWRRVLTELPAGNRAFAFSMALAVLLLMLGGAWLLLQTKRLREELAQTRTGRATQAEREIELQRQLERERTRIEDLNAELSRERSQGTKPLSEPRANPAAPAFATLLLRVGGIRGAEMGPAPTLTIPPGTEQVRLQLNMREGGYSDYRVVLQPIGGDAIFSREGLTPGTTKSGLTLLLMVPARDFATGDYILTLRGVGPGGEAEDVSKSIFRVKKR